MAALIRRPRRSEVNTSFLQAALGLKDESQIDVGADQVRGDLQSRPEMGLGSANQISPSWDWLQENTGRGVHPKNQIPKSHRPERGRKLTIAQVSVKVMRPKNHRGSLHRIVSHLRELGFPTLLDPLKGSFGVLGLSGPGNSFGQIFQQTRGIVGADALQGFDAS